MIDKPNKPSKPARAPRKLNASRFSAANQVRNVWAVTPEEGTDFDELLRPDYWAHIAKSLRPNDILEVVPDENDYFARLMVRDVGNIWAEVVLLDRYEFEAIEDRTVRPDGLAVTWKGPHLRFSVIRVADGKVVKTGFAEKAAASRWIADNDAAQRDAA